MCDSFLLFIIFTKGVLVKMKAVNIAEIEPGTELERDIFDAAGRLLLTKGTVLIQELLDSLKNKEIDIIYVIDDAYMDNVIDTDTKPKDDYRQNRIKEILKHHVVDANIEKIYNKMIFEMHRTTIRGTYKKIIQSNFREDIDSFLKILSLKTDEAIISFLMHQKGANPGYKYEKHSVNTALISFLIARWLGNTNLSVDELCLAALLHDIGEYQIPREIYDKKGPLNNDDWKQIKLHPLYGADILGKTPWINNRVADAVIKHHERLDGTGYPLGCTGSKIPIMPRIISIAVALDSTTTDKPYRKAMSTFNALAELRDNSFGQLDAGIVRLLYDKILIFYEGSQVTLNNNDTGTICLALDGDKRPYIKGNNRNYDVTITGAPIISSISRIL